MYDIEREVEAPCIDCIEFGRERFQVRNLMHEIKRLKTALIEIRDIWIDIPPEDLIANLKATAAVALSAALTTD